MNRRGFLRGLFAAAAVVSVNRVYSFPSEIVIPTGNLPKCHVRVCGPRFRENLREHWNKPFQENLKNELMYRDYIRYF